MHRGTTPTFILTLPEDVNLDLARNVYVTVTDHKGKHKLTKTDCLIDGNEVRMTLSQEETLGLASAYIQINWTYLEGTAVKRAASEIVPIHFKRNLEEVVLE